MKQLTQYSVLVCSVRSCLTCRLKKAEKERMSEMVAQDKESKKKSKSKYVLFCLLRFELHGCLP